VGLAPSTGLLFAAVALLVLAGLAAPYNRTILANTVLPSEQAQVFAAFSAVESFSTLLSPLMTVLYSFSASNGTPELPFFVMAFLLLCSNAILCYVRVTPALRHNLPDEIMKNAVVFSSFSAIAEEACDCTSTAAGDGGERERLISS
jgi:MFS-type transporter involved in bile tolerance (Atg22 family)